MKRFQIFRPNPPDHYVRDGYAVAPDKVQVEGIQFSDGRVAVRWCTPTASTSVWDSFDDFIKVHGHPEYKTEINWLDQ